MPGTTTVSRKPPNPIDIHVGSRVRMRRVLMGLSQEKLGHSLGLTFQQVQKYEKGTNRIGASRLQRISEVLNVPVAFFFDGAPVPTPIAGETSTHGFSGFNEPSSSYMVDYAPTAEGVELNRAFSKIQDPKVRKRILDLVRSLADDAPDETTSPETAK